LQAIAEQLHGPLLAHVRGRMRDQSEAEDIAQESWARASAAIGNGEGAIANIRAYLYRVARNLMIDHHRHTAVGVEVKVDDAILATIPDGRPDPESMLVTRDELRRMDRIITAMPARAREVFRLCRIEGLSYAEVGRQLGISRQTVQDHTIRALLAIQIAADGDFDARA
jgi:RNA polymerase sigma-70 factor (ECF subfamily)